MMDIKSKIASYEAHNEAVRSTTKVTTPTREGEAVAATSTTSMASHSRRERIQREVKDSPLRLVQQPQQPTSATTSMASHSRRERIQREVKDSPLRLVQQPQQPTSAGSLAERRRVRQMQKQKRLTKESSESPATSGTGSTKKGSSKKSNAPPESAPTNERRRSRRSSGTNGNRSSETNGQFSSNRRYVHSLSMESSESYEERGMEDVPLSPERRLAPAKAAKVHRMHPRKQYHEDQPSEDTTPPRMTEFNQHPLTASPGEPTDDEVTLTSVRQIMQPEGGIMHSGSSSTIETDGEPIKHPVTMQTNTQAFLTRSALGGADDERTFDYGEWDDRDDGSVTYEQRKEAEKKAKEAKGRGFVDDTNSPLLNTEDVSYYRQTLDTPAAKVTAGIVLAGTVGCIILGPVGLLVGAAAVGIGVGVMQIPEEQREHVKSKAVKAVHQAHESAVSASEAISTSCAASCHDLGCVDHFPGDMKEFFENPSSMAGANGEASKNDGAAKQRADRSADNMGPGLSIDGRKSSNLSNQSPSKMGKRRAACLRNSRIVPVDQVHSLEPSLQPRAWIDVMASANTTRDEKNEGMEEILILAKDKRHARFFLEEGILDSIMWIIIQYMESGKREDAQEQYHAKLAAQCCVTLGKAHCALVHTEGDLQLMSLYERGLVPEERQLAQMLYEVPHHVQVALSSTEDVFVLKQVPMAQAEELARSIMALADGRSSQ